MVVNSQLSDHNTICLNLNYENVKVAKTERRTNHYHSQIPEYNFHDADEEDWLRLNLELDKVDWSSIMDDKSSDELTEAFLVKLLEKVSLIFKKLSSFDDNEEKIQQKQFSSKNKIPREIRILMRNKRKISQAIQRAKSMDRCWKNLKRL